MNFPFLKLSITLHKRIIFWNNSNNCFCYNIIICMCQKWIIFFLSLFTPSWKQACRILYKLYDHFYVNKNWKIFIFSIFYLTLSQPSVLLIQSTSAIASSQGTTKFVRESECPRLRAAFQYIFSSRVDMVRNLWFPIDTLII